MTTTKINERLMIARLSIHQWYPRKYDAKASREIAEHYGAESADRAGRYNKILVDLATIKPLQQRIRQLRGDHAFMTAPWADNGERVLPVDLYFDYVEKVRIAEQEIAALADEYAYGDYQRQRELAQVALGGLFKESDYPTAEDLRARFGIEIRFEPIPNADDARTWGIGDQAAEQIARDVRSSLEAATQKAHQHVVDQVVSRAKEFVQKVRAYHEGDASKLYDTAVTNLKDITDLVIKGLNITGSADLDSLAAELHVALGDTSADQLKLSESDRIGRTAQIESIVSKFDGVFA